MNPNAACRRAMMSLGVTQKDLPVLMRAWVYASGQHLIKYKYTKPLANITVEELSNFNDHVDNGGDKEFHSSEKP